MLRLNFKRVVIEGAVEVCASAGEVVVITRLLLMEARVIDEPFLSGRRTDVGIDAVVVFVE